MEMFKPKPVVEQELPGKETYDVSQIEDFLEDLEKKPEKLAKFRELARNRAKDIFDSGNLKEKFEKDDLALYIGAGTGHVPEYIEEQTEAKMIKFDLADLRTSDTKDEKFAEASARNLPIKDGAVDIVCLFDMLHHTENQEEILKEALRVLKPGGKCLVMEDTIPEPHEKSTGIIKKLVGKVDDLFNKQPSGVNPHNYHSISDWEIAFHDVGFDVDANETRSWYWGVSDFLPVEIKRPEQRTPARPFESTMFEITKPEEKR